MKKKIEHTPTPWRRGRGAGYLTVGPLIVANDNQEANAAFVERAVNAHEELMVTLKDLLEYHNDDIDDGYKYQRRAAAQRARQVIARLEGKL